jgi:glycogen operon protein
MVKVLHKEGIEIILDVVYNHTGEGSEMGPTLCFRGIDNWDYYRLDPDNKRSYVDFTGTGNTLDSRQPWTLQLIMDSLRYWVTEMHVDGFRFDLAPALARDLQDVDWLSSFFNIIYQDPILCHVKLIAEPWDVGDKGYQVGMFPSNWAEWNGRYRDTMRDYWRGQAPDLRMFLLRFFGSPDLYKHNGRTPGSSVNFITAHDGFTLHDLATYEQKHNEANGNNNEDGTDENKSKNFGIEGETDDAATNRLRMLYKKNMLATLLLSQGVPMLRAGDEFGNSQGGNNNTYNQDNETSWISWDKADNGLTEFTSKLVHIRKDNPILSQHNWAFVKDELWEETAGIELYTQEGEQLLFKDTDGKSAATIGILLKEVKAAKKPDDSTDMKSVMYIIFNSSNEKLHFHLPNPEPNQHWLKIIDTYADELDFDALEDATDVEVNSFSVVVLKQQPPH